MRPAPDPGLGNRSTRPEGAVWRPGVGSVILTRVGGDPEIGLVHRQVARGSRQIALAEHQEGWPVEAGVATLQREFWGVLAALVLPLLLFEWFWFHRRT